jgi:uncharacterized membrane protein YeaQ/YmgE (transglycosylase-associated protein family)
VEGFLDALGIVALVLLVGIGLLAGWLAGAVAGRRKGLYLLLGVAGAVAAPFILAALGVGILAAGSLVALVIVAALGAVLLLVLARSCSTRLRAVARRARLSQPRCRRGTPGRARPRPPAKSPPRRHRESPSRAR